MKRLTALLLALAPLLADASYYSLTRDTAEAQECVTFDVRYPYWTHGIYLATYPGHSRSEEGWHAPYYGGIVSDDRSDTQLIQFASWQMGGKGAPASGIDFVHAGPHMSWVRSTWEGSSGGIKGRWPNAEFRPGVWYRFVHRVWQPATPTPGLGYAGVWMKDLDSSRWHHLATFKFPARLTGFNSMGGFVEYFTGDATEKAALEFRNSYARRAGRWGAESEFVAFNHKEDSILLQPSADNRSILLETTHNPKDAEGKRPHLPVVTQKHRLTQPEQPDFFDVARVGAPAAEYAGDRLVVRWTVDARSAPQLGYTVELVENGAVTATHAENDPNARLAVLPLTRKPAPGATVRVRLTDIFGGASAPAETALRAAAPLPAVAAPANAASGLAYRYYETEKPESWTRLPDFAALTPRREGATAAPDLTPRLRRTGYAFDFAGYLRAPKDGLYDFTLVCASGAKLIIDDTTVIDADGRASIAKHRGAVALRAGLHRVRLPYYQGARQFLQSDDFLQLRWAGPGFADTAVGPENVMRPRAAGEPALTLEAKPAGTGGIAVNLAARVAGAPARKIDRVEYYATNADFDYFSMQGARGADYFLTQSERPETPARAAIWAGERRTVRARLVYDGGKTIDSAPVLLPAAPTPPATLDGRPLTLATPEHHLYRPGYAVDGDTVSLVGESVAFLATPFSGDGTMIARLADVTPATPLADGTRPEDAQNWYAGIIIRDNLNAAPGEPLGGAHVPFTAVMGSASGATRHCDSTMINGAGNQPSGDVGGDHRWYKLERRGAEFTTSISKDGVTWKPIKTVSLPKMSATPQVGFVIYAIPQSTPIVHRATFDHIRINR